MPACASVCIVFIGDWKPTARSSVFHFSWPIIRDFWSVSFISRGYHTLQAISPAGEQNEGLIMRSPKGR